MVIERTAACLPCAIHMNVKRQPTGKHLLKAVHHQTEGILFPQDATSITPIEVPGGQLPAADKTQDGGVHQGTPLLHDVGGKGAMPSPAGMEEARPGIKARMTQGGGKAVVQQTIAQRKKDIDGVRRGMSLASQPGERAAQRLPAGKVQPCPQPFRTA